MNRIAVLIDFTEISKIALKQAAVIAKASQAEIHAINFAGDNVIDDSLDLKLMNFVRESIDNNILFKTVVAKGDLMSNAAFALGHIDPKFVVICTHGVHGLKQHLFGAHILKLVQAIPYPSIVVQANTIVKEKGFSKILFPVGPHKKFEIKINQTLELCKVFDSTVYQYEIDRGNPLVDENLIENIKTAKDVFSSASAKFESIVEEVNVISVGYSRQTLNFAADNNIDLISMMADVPNDEIYFGSADKENILTNAHGIPVLCCNSKF